MHPVSLPIAYTAGYVKAACSEASADALTLADGYATHPTEIVIDPTKSYRCKRDVEKGEIIVFRDLFIIEKIIIMCRCHLDIRKNRFCDYKYESTTGKEIAFKISPFIVNEVSVYKMFRARRIWKSIVPLVIQPKHKLLGIRLFRLPSALCKLDELISITKSEVKYASDSTSQRVEELKSMSMRYQQAGAPHHVEMYNNQIATAKREHADKKHIIQKDLLFYEYQKKRLVLFINSKINAKQSHCIRRIQLYYNYAYSCSNKGTCKLFTDEDFEVLSEIILDSDHTITISQMYNNNVNQNNSLME